MARYLSVLTPSTPFCPLFHRLSVSLCRSCRPRPSLLLLPCLHSTSKSIRSPAKPLFPLFRKLSDALSRAHHIYECSIFSYRGLWQLSNSRFTYGYLATWISSRVFPAGGAVRAFSARRAQREVTNLFLKQKLSNASGRLCRRVGGILSVVDVWHTYFEYCRGAMYSKQLF